MAAALGGPQKGLDLRGICYEWTVVLSAGSSYGRMCFFSGLSPAVLVKVELVSVCVCECVSECVFL